MTIVLNKMTVIVLMVLFKRESVNNFLNLLNVLSLIGNFDNACTFHANDWWVSSWIFQRVVHLSFLKFDILIDISSNIFVFTWSFILFGFSHKGTVLRHIDSDVPNDLSMELGHLNKDIEIIIEILRYITWMLVLVTITNTDKSFVKFL